MPIDYALTQKIIAKAESLRDGVCAGIVRLEDVLQGPSYRAVQDAPGRAMLFGDDIQVVDWPVNSQSVVVLGLKHPRSDLRLDWWERGDTFGNRHLRRMSQNLKRWLFKHHGLNAVPLPYNVEKGGLFLKDAAVLAGLGIVGRNNLVVHPQFGPRVRWRSVLIMEVLTPTAPIQGFAPCATCDSRCHQACPTGAFAQGSYARPACMQQLNKDEARREAEGRFDVHGRYHPIIRYCRACELACPVGT